MNSEIENEKSPNLLLNRILTTTVILIALPLGAFAGFLIGFGACFKQGPCPAWAELAPVWVTFVFAIAAYWLAIVINHKLSLVTRKVLLVLSVAVIGVMFTLRWIGYSYTIVTREELILWIIPAVVYIALVMLSIRACRKR